jgi:hypothetical protein
LLDIVSVAFLAASGHRLEQAIDAIDDHHAALSLVDRSPDAMLSP